MERYNQLEKLKEINGGEIIMPKIPDYIDQNFLNEHLIKRNSSSSASKASGTSKEENRRMAGRSKSFKILKKRKIQVFNFDEEKQKKMKVQKEDLLFKRRTLKM